ncbi:type iv fimbrial assembly protein : : T2SE_Nter [Gemmataceae bacterium]|nr:type iv fimbrial assembly protein : : T2SE_Nter [Gemmataceae bacterium]VTT97306.1 type iv fimbrial assembly protein : : T2SE_Nter [Gemmataceae bacterium]
MPTHPDADAFVRAILASPEDVTARLAFADWLQEQGGVPNLAWACYVRLHIEIADLESRGKKCGLLRREADGHATYITANVSVPAAAIRLTHDFIEQIIPSSRCMVTLAGCDIPHEVIEWVPIAVAHEESVLPLSIRGQSLVLAAAAPHSQRLATGLGSILENEVLIVGADSDELLAEITHYYGRWEPTGDER